MAPAMTAPRTNSTEESVWGAFVDGAFRPSAGGLCGTLLVFVSLVAVSAALLTPENVISFEVPYYLRRKVDPFLHATASAFRAERETPHPEAVGVFGASAQLSGLGNDEEASAALFEATGREIPVRVVCAPGIGPAELLTQIRRTAPGCPGAIVIGISPMKLGPPTPQLKKRCLALLEPDFATGVYLFDHWAFWIPRIDAAIRRGLLYHTPFVANRIPPQRTELGDTSRPYTEELFARQLPFRVRVVERAIEGLESPESGLPAFEALIAELRAEGRNVVLLESVLNPRLASGVDGEHWATYQAAIAGVVERTGAHYWNLAEDAELVPEDFYDIGHMGRPEVRARYGRALAARLAPLLDSTESAR